MKKILLILAMVLFAVQAWGLTYYDSSADTTTSYETIAAMQTAKTMAGDDIIDLEGATFNETITVNGSGSSDHPVIIQNGTITRGALVASWVDQGGGLYRTATENEYAWIDGYRVAKATDSDCLDGVWWGSGSYLYYRPADNNPSAHTVISYDSYGIEMDDKDYITIKNIDFEYCGGAIYCDTGSTNIKISDCNINKTGKNAIRFENGGSNLFVTDNRIYECVNAVYFWTGTSATTEHYDGVTVTGNIISYCNYNHLVAADGHAVGLQRTQNAIITDNTISFAYAPIVFWTDSTTYTTSDNLVSRNLITNNKDGIDAVWSDSAAMQLQDDADNASIDNVFSMNVIQNCAGGFYTHAGSASLGTNYLVNNTFIGCDRSIFLSGGVDYQIVKNNLSINPDTYHQGWKVRDAGAPVAIESDYNSYYPEGENLFVYLGDVSTDFTEWTTDSSQDAHSITTNPLLVQTWKLKEDSPALGEGVDIEGINDSGELDIVGNAARVGDINMGAYCGYGMIGGGGNNMSLGAFGISGGFNIGGQGIGLYSPGWREGSAPPVPGTIDYDDTWAAYTDAWGDNYTKTWL